VLLTYAKRESQRLLELLCFNATGWTHCREKRRISCNK